MDFLKNINKEFRFNPEYNFIKNEYHYLFRKKDENIKLEDVIVLVDDINKRSVYLTIKSIGNIDQVVDKLASLVCERLVEDAEKFKVIANKVIKAWEKTPEKFVEQVGGFVNKKTYKHKGLLNDDEYGLSVFAMIGKISYHSNFSFSTGWGGDSYHDKDFYVNRLSEIDPWVSKIVKEVNSTKVKTRIKNQLLKINIDIPISKIETRLELIGKNKSKDKISKKPPFPMTFSYKDMNFFLSQIGECFLDEELIEELDEEYELDLSSLLNWEVSIEHEGYHHNDGQICDYTVTFTSPEGHEYHAYNSHCLVTGWNFYGEVVIE